MAGNLAISFYERRSKNKLFGLVNQEEKIVWEQWILRVVVNNTPRPMGEDEASIIERQRIQVSLGDDHHIKVSLCSLYCSQGYMLIYAEIFFRTLLRVC